MFKIDRIVCPCHETRISINAQNISKPERICFVENSKRKFIDLELIMFFFSSLCPDQPCIFGRFKFNIVRQKYRKRVDFIFSKIDSPFTKLNNCEARMEKCASVFDLRQFMNRNHSCSLYFCASSEEYDVRQERAPKKSSSRRKAQEKIRNMEN